MSAAPVVQSLNDLISTVGQGVAAQKAQYDTEIAQNDASGAAQVAALGAAKDQAFSNIEDNANAKGMYFSGFSPDAQAKYTAATYLPALAKLQTTIAATRNGLLQDKNALDTQVFNTAYNTQQSQQAALNTYNNQQDQFAHEDQTLATQEAFQAQEDAANRNEQAAEAAASRAASSSSTAQESEGNREVDARIALGQDISAGFASAGAKSNGYTEKTLLPQLYAAYGDLGDDYISKQVYLTRKSQLGY